VAEHLMRRAEVHRLVGCNRRLCELIGELRYLDFPALLGEMVAASRTQSRG